MMVVVDKQIAGQKTREKKSWMPANNTYQTKKLEKKSDRARYVSTHHPAHVFNAHLL